MILSDKDIRATIRSTQEEIVSWASEACPHATGATKYYKRVCDLCWQEKLREWGIK